MVYVLTVMVVSLANVIEAGRDLVVRKRLTPAKPNRAKMGSA